MVRLGGKKLKILENMRKTTLEPLHSSSEQKTAPKNTSYSKNDNFSKIAKTRHIRVVLCKKQLQKTPNIPKMRTFPKSAKLATMHGL